MQDKIKIALCTHIFNYVDADIYLNHLACANMWSDKYNIVFCGKKGLSNDSARNSLIVVADANKCDYAFFLDADHFIPFDTLDILTESAEDAAMLSGLVCKKGETYQQVGWIKQGKEYLPCNLPLDGKRYEVDVCAFGCTLVNMKKIALLEKPYFRDTFEDGVALRSDVNICDAFRAINEKVFIDTRVLVGHLGIMSTVYPQNASTMLSVQLLEREAITLKTGQCGSYYKTNN